MATALNNKLIDFLSALNMAESVDEVWQITVVFMRGMGANHVAMNVGLDTDDPLLRWTTPSWIREFYKERVYPNHDPGLEYCRKNTVPGFFGHEFEAQKDNLPAPRRQFVEELTSVGILTECKIPVHTCVGKDWGIVILATDLCAQDFTALLAEHGTTLHLAGLVAFERMRALINAEQAEGVRLSPREREVLLWLGRGLRNKEIAHRLGLRPVTVELHIANAKRKLNSRTREQALVNAVQLGVLAP